MVGGVVQGQEVILYLTIGALISLLIGYIISGEAGRETFKDVTPVVGSVVVLVLMVYIVFLWPVFVLRAGYKRGVDRDD